MLNNERKGLNKLIKMDLKVSSLPRAAVGALLKRGAVTLTLCSRRSSKSVEKVTKTGSTQQSTSIKHEQ